MIWRFPARSVQHSVAGAARIAASVSHLSGYGTRIDHGTLAAGVVVKMLLMMVLMMLKWRLGIDGRATVGNGRSSWYEQDVPVSRLLQAVLVRAVRLAVGVAERLEHVAIQLGKTILDAGLFGRQKFALFVQTDLPFASPFHFVGQCQDLVQLALATVLSRDLVLATSADIADERQLRFRQVVFAQSLVEFIHGQVDDVVHRHGDVHRAGALLIPRVRFALRKGAASSSSWS